MKITPLEIRQKSFEKGFRGYEKEEVNAYLHSLSMEWERLLKENKEAQAKAVELEKEVSKLRAVESSLFKTLKTAEDTGANMIDQATKMAEIHMKETEMRTEGILNEAKTKARDTIEEAELMAKKTIEDMEDQLKSLIQDYKTLENFRDDVLADIKALSTDALERVERMKAQVKRFNLEDHFFKAKRESKEVIANRLSANSSAKKMVMEEQKTQKESPRAEKWNTQTALPIVNKPERSFFDDID